MAFVFLYEGESEVDCMLVSEQGMQIARERRIFPDEKRVRRNFMKAARPRCDALSGNESSTGFFIATFIIFANQLLEGHRQNF